MENMNKEPTVPKWVLINRPKLSQMPQIFSAQFVSAQAQKFGIFEESSFWVSVLRGLKRQFKVKS